MINYIVYILIIIILVLVFSIAVKAAVRGIKAKQRLNKDLNNQEKYESKKNSNKKY